MGKVGSMRTLAAWRPSGGCADLAAVHCGCSMPDMICENAQGAAFANSEISLGFQGADGRRGIPACQDSQNGVRSDLGVSSPLQPVEHVQEIGSAFSFRFHFLLNRLEHWDCF